MGAKNRWALAAASALACALPSLAHHAVTAEFDPAKTITLRGVISKVEWINERRRNPLPCR
jgi:hypothetical protein